MAVERVAALDLLFLLGRRWSWLTFKQLVKRSALARAVRSGLLANDSARVDEARVLVRSVEQLEAARLRVARDSPWTRPSTRVGRRETGCRTVELAELHTNSDARCSRSSTKLRPERRRLQTTDSRPRTLSSAQSLQPLPRGSSTAPPRYCHRVPDLKHFLHGPSAGPSACPEILAVRLAGSLDTRDRGRGLGHRPGGGR